MAGVKLREETESAPPFWGAENEVGLLREACFKVPIGKIYLPR